MAQSNNLTWYNSIAKALYYNRRLGYKAYRVKSRRILNEYHYYMTSIPRGGR